MDNLPNFTPRVQQSIKFAKKFAIHQFDLSVSPIHLLYGISKVQHSVADLIKTLDDLSWDLKAVNPENKLVPGEFDIKNLSYSRSFKKVLRESVALAKDYLHDYVGIEHVLICVLNDSEVSAFLNSFDISSKSLSKKILYILEGEVIHKHEDVANYLKNKNSINSFPASKNTPTASDSINAPQECEFLTNLSSLAASGNFDKLICRSKDLERVSEILSRRHKNNPILLGEPGVGKTAIIEGLASEIAFNSTYSHLSNRTIYSLNLSYLLSGTKYRGQFEEKLKNALQKYFIGKENILFIDEIHTLIGAGGAEGGLDAANILKPLLSRGDISCIGATTPLEYKKTIEKDKALSRRFQTVHINEPSADECLLILQGLKKSYESFHQVKYSKKTLSTAIDLSIRYIGDRFLPDKAIDLLDEAGAHCKLKLLSKPEDIFTLEKKLEKLIDLDNDPSNEKDFSKKIESLFVSYQSILDKWQKDIKSKTIYVKPSDIESLISKKTSIPLNVIRSSIDKKILKLKSSLTQDVTGQEEAVECIYEALLRSSFGLSAQDKPLNSFLLTGKTGTGKTLTAKSTAKYLFGSDKDLIRVDMGEYTESSSTSKLLGASPGYIGYEEGSKFIDSVRAKPFSVILFDEVEKAHPDVLKSLLALLDEGKLSDNLGRVADFSNCLIFFTSNIGSHFLSKASPTIGFNTSDNSTNLKSKVIDACKTELSPEFINRIDEIICFNDFSRESYIKIINNLLIKLESHLKKNGFNILVRLDDSLINFFISELEKINLGARPINKLFKKFVESKIAESFLSNSSKSNILVSYVDGEISIS